MKFNYNNFILGVVVGMLSLSIATLMGEQRYSDAIKACVQMIGPNK